MEKHQTAPCILCLKKPIQNWFIAHDRRRRYPLCLGCMRWVASLDRLISAISKHRAIEREIQTTALVLLNDLGSRRNSPVVALLRSLFTRYGMQLKQETP